MRGEKFSPDWEKFVLRQIFESMLNSPRGPEGALMRYSRLGAKVRHFLTVNNRDINSVNVMLSRTVWRLIEKKQVDGWFREWTRWHVSNHPLDLRHGSHPQCALKRAPRLAYLQLMPDGIQRCRQLWPNLRAEQIALEKALTFEDWLKRSQVGGGPDEDRDSSPVWSQHVRVNDADPAKVGYSRKLPRPQV